MSNPAIDWAISTRARGSAKAVLFVMANAAREKPTKSLATGKVWDPHHSWMSHGSIADQAGIDVKTVPAALAKLEAAGLITAVGTDGATGQVKVYRLAVKVPENGGLSDEAKTPESGDLHTPLGAPERSPVLDSKVPVFSGKGPRFFRERSPKTGYETQLIPEGTPEGTPEGCGDLFGHTDIPASAVADPGPKGRKVKASKPTRETKTAATWDAYATAWQRRHGATAFRDAATNAQLARLVDTAGAERAPAIAAHFVHMDRPAYVSAKHPVWMLVKDAQAIHADMRSPGGAGGPSPGFSDKNAHAKHLLFGSAAAHGKQRQPVAFSDVIYREEAPDANA